MIMSGRKTNLMIALEDKPGQLTRVSEIISGMGANVVSVQYDLADPNIIIEHFGNAVAVPQPPERCLSRQAGIVRYCLRK